MMHWARRRMPPVASAAGVSRATLHVSDFARLCSEHVAAGRHHRGVLIALSSRFSRRPGGFGTIVAAVVAVAGGMSSGVLDSAGMLLPADLRSLDAIHLATAQRLGQDLGAIVTYDERMANAATNLGHPVVVPA